MQHLSDEQLAKIPGLNVAKMFRFVVDKLLARRRQGVSRPI